MLIGIKRCGRSFHLILGLAIQLALYVFENLVAPACMKLFV